MYFTSFLYNAIRGQHTVDVFLREIFAYSSPISKLVFFFKYALRKTLWSDVVIVALTLIMGTLLIHVVHF